MADLIDNYKDSQETVNGKWYIAKPVGWQGWYKYVLRFKDAIGVLTGKYTAVYFAKDNKGKGVE